MQGNTYPHMHTRVHTPHIHIHTQQRPVWMGSWPPWRLLASARAGGGVGGRPSIPVGVTLLFLPAQAPGSCSAKPGKGLLQRTPKPLGRPVLCS